MITGLHVSQNLVYQRDVGILKRYADNVYKLIHMRALRQRGFENEEGKGIKNTAENTYKLSQSLSRTKARIYELAICNPWEHFVTLTLAPDKHDRQDLNAFQKRFSRFINNINYRRGLNVKYLLIPEPHKSGAWHMHGFFMGLPSEALREFTLAEKLPNRLRRRIRQLDKTGEKVYTWAEYSEKFGYCVIERIQNHNKCAKYVTKYITKELEQSKIALNHHMYYASLGLQRAEVVFQDTIRQAFEADYENDYVRLKDYDNIEDAMQPFCDEQEIIPTVTPKMLTKRLFCIKRERFYAERKIIQNKNFV